MGDYLTIGEISARYGIKRGYAYRLACLHKWQRYRGPDGRVRYRRQDVEAMPSIRKRALARDDAA